MDHEIEGASIVLLESPKGLIIGIDLKSWVSGEKFMGVKMIPPGIHQVYWRVEEDINIRGLFLNLNKGDVICLYWEPNKGDFVEPEVLGKGRVLQEHLRELDPFLAAFPVSTEKELIEHWERLINRVTPDTLREVLPNKMRVQSTTPSTTSNELEMSSITNNDIINFKKVNLKRSWDQNAIGSERSRWAQDKSWELLRITKLYDNRDFQLAFILFIITQNFDGFEYWKTLVHLFCKSGDLVEREFEFFRCFIVQLELMPSDFTADIILEGNFAIKCLESFINTLNEIPTKDRFEVKFLKKKIINFMLSQFNYDLEKLNCEKAITEELEVGEYAPTIVTLSSED